MAPPDTFRLDTAKPDLSLGEDIDASVSSGIAENSVDSTPGTHTNSTDEKITREESGKLNLARKETTAVFRLRLLVFFVLLFAAVAVSVIVYYVTANAEQDEYFSQYEGKTERVWFRLIECSCF
jgi:hypothetical protein